MEIAGLMSNVKCTELFAFHDRKLSELICLISYMSLLFVGRGPIDCLVEISRGYLQVTY